MRSNGLNSWCMAQKEEGMGPNRYKNKRRHFAKNADCWMVFQVPGKFILLGSFFGKLIGFIWRSKDHLEDEGPIWTHLEDQGSFGDEGTFQECRKSSIFKKPIIRWDRKLEARGPFRCRICFRSILSRQNGLNRHMEQTRKGLAENPVFQFFGL